MPRLAGLAFLTSVVLGCSSKGGSADPDRTTASASIPSAASPSAPRKVEWVPLPAAIDPSAFIRGELDRAKQDKKKLLIYVGAKWCEPCQRFHKAAEAGELDAVFPDLRFIDLDANADEEVIGSLECGSRLIPLFAMPDENGHCTDRRVEGGIKGDGAVGYIGPRLRALVGPIQ